MEIFAELGETLQCFTVGGLKTMEVKDINATLQTFLYRFPKLKLYFILSVSLFPCENAHILLIIIVTAYYFTAEWRGKGSFIPKIAMIL